MPRYDVHITLAPPDVSPERVLELVAEAGLEPSDPSDPVELLDDGRVHLALTVSLDLPRPLDPAAAISAASARVLEPLRPRLARDGLRLVGLSVLPRSDEP